ncbi:MAG: hypothetical protein H0X40_14125 [Chthoniobacterales bacterium]|nr:hypothetical protein [Chthoniobacterales bacterium]
MDSEQMTGAAGDFAEQGLRYAKDQWGEIMGQTEDYVRANPTKALFYGVAAGYILNRLPIFKLFGVLVRLLLLALKPALLIFGATKIYQATQQDT